MILFRLVIVINGQAFLRSHLRIWNPGCSSNLKFQWYQYYGQEKSPAPDTTQKASIFALNGRFFCSEFESRLWRMRNKELKMTWELFSCSVEMIQIPFRIKFDWNFSSLLTSHWLRNICLENRFEKCCKSGLKSRSPIILGSKYSRHCL